MANRHASTLQPVFHRSEDRWLMTAVREVLLGRREAVDEPVPAGMDWPFLLRQASLHAAVPALARYCQRRDRDVPADVLAQLQREQVHAGSYNFFLLQELVRLTRALQENRVRTLAWKGPALAAAVYPEPGLRQCADLDLLIAPPEMEAAIAALRLFGYVEVATDTGGHTRNLWRESPKVVVELHHLVVQPHFAVALDADTLLAGAVSLKTAAGSVPVPAPETLLFMLCVHGGKHGWDRLGWICDVALFLRAHPQLDWDRVRRLAGECRAVRMLHLGLLLADALDPGVAPAAVLDAARADAGAVTLARRVLDWLFLPEHDFRHSMRQEGFQLSLRENLRDRLPLLRHLTRLGLTPNDADRATVKLPRWLDFAYYLVRPARLLAKVLRPRRKERA